MNPMFLQYETKKSNVFLQNCKDLNQFVKFLLPFKLEALIAADVQALRHNE